MMVRIVILIGIGSLVLLATARCGNRAPERRGAGLVGENAPPGQLHFEPFGEAIIWPDFEVDGQGRNIDSLAFWEAPDPTETLLFVSAKGNQLVEVWQYPFVDHERPPLRHDSFGRETRVNGLAIDQAQRRLYVVVSKPVSTVAVFSIPQLQFSGQFITGAVNLRSEPNISLLNRLPGEPQAYISADDIVYIYDVETGRAIDQFRPAKGLETMAADPFYQLLYIPDENDRSGVYVYNPDGSSYARAGRNRFGERVFQADAEGIALYTCSTEGGRDDGRGLIVVADQQADQTEFEFFDRQTWAHLGRLKIVGVANTDGIASTQQALPDYPLGLFAAVNDDTSVVGVGWARVLAATGLDCRG